MRIFRYHNSMTLLLLRRILLAKPSTPQPPQSPGNNSNSSSMVGRRRCGLGSGTASCRSSTAFG